MTALDPALEPVIEALIALIMAILAYYTNKYRKETTYALKFFHPSTAAEVPTDFIDEKIPPETWRMAPEVKEFIKAGHSPQEQALIEAIITNAEENHRVKYTINLSDVTYQIEYGQVVRTIRKSS